MPAGGGGQTGENEAGGARPLPLDPVDSPHRSHRRPPMPLSVSSLVLRAKELELEALHHLAARVELADVIGQLIHALQRERGATSVHLASGGQRFAAERLAALDEAVRIESRLRELFEVQRGPQHGASARTLSLMAWVLLDLDALSGGGEGGGEGGGADKGTAPGLRARIEQRSPTAHEAVAAFSRLIAGLLELLFHVADASRHPGIARLLVAFVHLAQGKEAAGQERAVGAQLFASGQCDEAEQQRVVHLIDAQERSLVTFEEFTDPTLRARWQQLQLTPEVAQLERLRRTLCTARPPARLDTALSEAWFALTSARIGEMEQMLAALVHALRHDCREQIRATEQDLLDSEGLLQRLRDNPPGHPGAVDRFFQDGQPHAGAPVLSALPQGEAQAATWVQLLQDQSSRLARMEAELEGAQRALQERKVIERAKGALMSKLGLSEEEALRTLQKASMDQNRRLLDVAQATLALPDLAFAAAQRG